MKSNMSILANTSKFTGIKIDPPTKTIDNKTRQAWNDYTTWLEKKGLKCHASLDKNDTGGKMIDAYRKENPATPISRELVPKIQEEFSKYRDWTIAELRARKAMITDAKAPAGRFVDENENLDNYMKDLSIVDGIPGQRTTSHNFPLRYMKTFDAQNNLLKKENLGFAALRK